MRKRGFQTSPKFNFPKKRGFMNNLKNSQTSPDLKRTHAAFTSDGDRAQPRINFRSSLRKIELRKLASCLVK